MLTYQELGGEQAGRCGGKGVGRGSSRVAECVQAAVGNAPVERSSFVSEDGVLCFLTLFRACRFLESSGLNLLGIGLWRGGCFQFLYSHQ